MKKQRITDRLRFTQTPYEGKVAGLYIRVSSVASVVKSDGKVDERESLTVQKAGCIEYAERHGWTYKIYEGDSEISGFEGTEDRPSLKALIADIEAGKIHTVICREIKRIYRSEPLQNAFIYNVLKPFGVNLKAYFEELDITTSEGMLVLGIKANRNQEELYYSATRSMASKASLAASGELIGKPALGYGIRKIDKVREVYVKEDEKAIVERVFELYNNGKSIRSIATQLNAEGIQTQGKKRFDGATVKGILTNRNYIGKIRYEGKFYDAPYPIFIDEKTFKTAQDNMSKNTKKHRQGANPKHLLSGLLLCGYCADAGKPVNSMSVGISNSHSTEGTYACSVYACSTKRREGSKACPDSTSIRRETIEAFVENLILEKITPEDLQKIAKLETKPSTDSLQKQLAELEKKISRIKASRSKILADIAKGEQDYNAELIRPMERNILDLQRQFDGIAAELRDSTLENAGKALSLRDQWRTLEQASRKRLIADLISSMRVYRDYLTIRFTVAPKTDFLYPLKRVGSGGKREPQYVSFDSLLTKPEGLLIKVTEDSEAMLKGLVDDMWNGKAPASVPASKPDQAD